MSANGPTLVTTTSLGNVVHGETVPLASGAHAPPPGFTVYRFGCKYLPTGEAFTRQVAVVGGRDRFLALLDRWSGMAPGVWSYWSLP